MHDTAETYARYSRNVYTIQLKRIYDSAETKLCYHRLKKCTRPQPTYNEYNSIMTHIYFAQTFLQYLPAWL